MIVKKKKNMGLLMGNELWFIGVCFCLNGLCNKKNIFFLFLNLWMVMIFNIYLLFFF